MKLTYWKQRGMRAIVAASLLLLPQIASARDGYERNSYYNGAYQSDPNYDSGYAYGQPRVDYAKGGYHSGYAAERYRYNYGRDYGYYSRRSPGKSAAIVGGSAAAGAVVGALAGGGKGAAVGAIVGGLGGVIFDQATKHRHRY